MAKKSRSWETHHETRVSHREDGKDAANIALVQAVVERGITSSYDTADVVEEVGGTRRLAQQLVDMGFGGKGKNPVANLQRNLQRYQNFEKTGVRSKNSFPAPEALKDAMASIMHAVLARDGIDISMGAEGGDSSITVNGYERDTARAPSFHMSSDQAGKFYDAVSAGDWKSAWGTLASSYGVSELHGYGPGFELFITGGES